MTDTGFSASLDNTTSNSPAGTFDMNAIIQSQSQEMPAQTPPIDLNALLNTVPQDQTHEVLGPGKINRVSWGKRVLGIVLVGGGLVVLYFAATIFYPIEVAKIQNSLAGITGGLTADSNGPVMENTAQTPPVNDSIQTPIADSIAESNAAVDGINGGFDSTSETAAMWDTILPPSETGTQSNTENTDTMVDANTTTDVGTSLGTPSYDDSFSSLETIVGMSDSAVENYILNLQSLRLTVEQKEAMYQQQNDARGITIAKTLFNRIDELIAGLQAEDNEAAIANIEANIAQINALLDALNK